MGVGNQGVEYRGQRGVLLGHWSHILSGDGVSWYQVTSRGLPPPPLEWRPLLHSVRILLECFLVLRLQFDFSFDIATFKGNSCVCDTVKFDHVLDQFSNVSAEALSECGTVQSLHSISFFEASRLTRTLCLNRAFSWSLHKIYKTCHLLCLNVHDGIA